MQSNDKAVKHSAPVNKAAAAPKLELNYVHTPLSDIAADEIHKAQTRNATTSASVAMDEETTGK